MKFCRMEKREEGALLGSLKKTVKSSHKGEVSDGKLTKIQGDSVLRKENAIGGTQACPTSDL